MPVIYPNLIPSIQAGHLFSKLVSDQSLSIRWITSNDPVMFEVANRPIADIAVRQLIIAKAIDQINLRLGHQSFFPFITQPKVICGSYQVELPISWIWDMNVTIPEKWQQLRLARIKRISGSNFVDGTGTDTEPTYDGILRLFFTASVATEETSLFYVDYDIASPLSYQMINIKVVIDEDINPVPETDRNTIAGQVTFRTLDLNEAETRVFLDNLPPPLDTSDSNHDGIYDNPTTYEIANNEIGVYGQAYITHGSGMLIDSAWNKLPDLGASVDAWIKAFNYPFKTTADRTSHTVVGGEPIIIPSGLFVEFNIVAPTSDGNIMDYNSHPVWINRIKLGTQTSSDPNYLTFYFATHDINDDVLSISPVEFGCLVVNRTATANTIIKIESINNLYLMTGANNQLFNQQFGSGYVVLSSKWGTPEVINFFDKFPLIIGSNQADFTKSSTIISPFAISRVPKYIPTKGQHGALMGSTSRREQPIYPSNNNMFVTEEDQGIGNRIDLHAKINPLTGQPITPNVDIEQYGYEGSLLAKKVTLIVNAAGTSHSYVTDVLPRLRCLFGRDFVHGDVWFDGTRWKIWDSISEAWIG